MTMIKTWQPIVPEIPGTSAFDLKSDGMISGAMRKKLTVWVIDLPVNQARDNPADAAPAYEQRRTYGAFRVRQDVVRLIGGTGWNICCSILVVRQKRPLF